jgi:RNA polymerase sigma factor (sigma-70 family)
MNIDNKELLKDLQANNRDLVIQKCEPIIYYYLHKLGFWQHFPAERDDLLQEGRIALLKCIQRYNGKAQFTTYAHNSVRNALYNYVAKMKLYKYGNLQELPDDVENENISTMKTLTLYDDVIEDIEKIENESVKKIIKFYFILEYTQQEIADELKVSQQWAAQVIGNFKKEMKEKYGN